MYIYSVYIYVLCVYIYICLYTYTHIYVYYIYMCVYINVDRYIFGLYVYIYIYISFFFIYKYLIFAAHSRRTAAVSLVFIGREWFRDAFEKKKPGGSQPFILCFLAEDESGTLSKKNNVIVSNKESRGCVGVFLERCVFFSSLFFIFF